MNVSSPRCGFVAVVGAPNSGKSTLINKLVGTKVSIVTPKVQTTRTRVLGIISYDQSQLIFIDTPGIHMPHRQLERAMVASAWRGVGGADYITVIVDSASDKWPEVQSIIRRLDKMGRKAILVLNKIDLVTHSKLLKLAEKLGTKDLFARTFMISGLKGDGLDDFLKYLSEEVPEGPWLFPEEQFSDMPQRQMAAEITREKLFLQLNKELPYSLTVETEGWKDRADGSIRIDQIIYVRRNSQRAIIIGSDGHRLKVIGKAARQELEELFNQRIHLFLFIKVRNKWIEDLDRYEQMGLQEDFYDSA